MPLSAAQKSEIIGRHRRGEADVGSPEVQIALLTARIQQAMEHFERHAKDRHSRHGLMRMVHRRRGLLRHLRGRDAGRYAALIETLGLRR